MLEIASYLTSNGKEPYALWLADLQDRQARAKIVVRVARMLHGNAGDVRFVGQGVWELRIDWGPGYRVYYARHKEQAILLLAGGDKRMQNRDISRAILYWQDWQTRNRTHG
jgi:putative addiction module killer protein